MSDINDYINEKIDESKEVGIFTSQLQTFLYSTSNYFSLMSLTHLRGSTLYLGNVIIPMLITFGVAMFMPMTAGFTWVLFLALTFAGLSTYGTVFYSLRKSTIIKNIHLTATDTAALYVSTFLLIGLSLMITIVVVMFWMYFLNSMGLIMTTFPLWDSTVNWTIQWGDVFASSTLWYYWVEQVVLCFSISFFIEKVVTTQKNFFICIFAYILAGIFFAGIMSSGLYINEDGSFVAITNDTPESDLNGGMKVPAYTWGSSFWGVSQLFPHYGANQVLSTLARNKTTYINEFGDVVYNQWYNIDIFKSLGDIQSRYYVFAPWIWVAILTYTSSIIERHNNHK